MLAFVDFEASSLSKHSYPIEIAWVFEDGRSYSSLIKPAPGWTDWSEAAQNIHGISQAQLTDEGRPVVDVARDTLSALGGHALYASAPSWDGKWLSALLRAAGHPRHALRLAKSDLAFFDAAVGILGQGCDVTEIKQLVQSVIMASASDRPAHRALPDARLELERLNQVRNAAHALFQSRVTARHGC